MLLTDEEIKASYSIPLLQETFRSTKRGLRLQEAQTLKAVADWSGVRCGDKTHQAYDKSYRVDCNLCMRRFVRNASEGKMPGEEE